MERVHQSLRTESKITAVTFVADFGVFHFEDMRVYNYWSLKDFTEPLCINPE